uniref:Uncharacterized protein n=1 Tax=Anguilla anguilla TaxID=7936 RepID=A0A0E9X9W8_ANGAN
MKFVVTQPWPLLIKRKYKGYTVQELRPTPITVYNPTFAARLPERIEAT